MLVQTTRTLSTLALRAMFYAALFAVVVLVHLSITGALRAQGWTPGLALFVSGAAVLAVVLVAVQGLDWIRARRAEHRELQRVRQRLPGGPCCVVWASTEAAQESEATMPWEVVGPLRARYPKLARRLGVEGVAVAEFEVGANGSAKNINCVYAWPSDVFYEAALEALKHARFQPRGDQHMRFGASYRMPFVFRIAGAATLAETGRHARPLRPRLQAAALAVEKLRRTG
jgi:TonB family protein